MMNEYTAMVANNALIIGLVAFGMLLTESM